MTRALIVCLMLALAGCDKGPDKASSDVPEGELDAGELQAGGRIDPRVVQAEAKIDGGEYDEALALLDAAIEDDGTQARFHFVRGNALAHLDRDDDAWTAYERAIELDPKDHWSHAALGQMAAFGRGDLDAAVAHFQTALQLEPEFAPAHLGLGAALYDLGRFDEAVEALETAGRLERSTDTLFLLAQAHAKRGQINAAKVIAAEAVELEPGVSGIDLRLLWARLLSADGENEAGKREFRRAADLAPEDPNVQIQAVRGLLKLGEVDEADRRLAPWREKMPDEPAVIINYGRILAAQGKLDASMAQFDSIIARGDPTLHAAHHHKISTLGAAGKCKRAKRALAAFEATKAKPKLVERARGTLTSCK